MLVPVPILKGVCMNIISAIQNSQARECRGYCYIKKALIRWLKQSNGKPI